MWPDAASDASVPAANRARGSVTGGHTNFCRIAISVASASPIRIWEAAIETAEQTAAAPARYSGATTMRHHDTVLGLMQPQTIAIDQEFERRLGLYDSTMVVVGSMIGSGIFIV